MAKILHVMDTASWVAYYRGLESNHPNALYQDPLALKLAGNLGRNISVGPLSAPFMTWFMALRTIGIDLLVEEAVRNKGVQVIVNMGAGLDTRPYRMNLPSLKAWIEVDFPDMIRSKEEKLAREKPTLPLSRVSFDLTNKDEMSSFLQGLDRYEGPVLVITEGVVTYLSNEQVEVLNQNLLSVKSIKYWIQDYRHGGYARGMFKYWMKWKMRRAPIRFEVGNWFEFFKNRGWKVAKDLSLVSLAAKYNRFPPTLMGLSFLQKFASKERLESYKNAPGFVLFERN